VKTEELDFEFPLELIAQAPKKPSRIMWVAKDTENEITKQELLNRFGPNDMLVINDTKVLKRRVFSQESLEILFVNEFEPNTWEVLFPSSRVRENQKIMLPEFIEMELFRRGRPQIVRVSKKLTADYFLRNGELPLPPYIQKSRVERHNRPKDQTEYQTAWAEKPGSLAAPTASFHFEPEDLEYLENRGVVIERITLHVGLGTFLPVSSNNLSEHVMHSEFFEVKKITWDKIEQAKKSGGKIWALGTTVVRALEAEANGPHKGSTDIFITPGYEFKVVDYLMTNFHQPRTTLLALVAAFAGKNRWPRAYNWAIKNNFRLFSYGDLSVWEKA